MSRFSRMGGGLVVLGVLAAASSCSRGPSRLSAPSINASAAGAAAIEMYDADKDGKLGGAELDKCPGLKAALPRLGSGEVTAGMITGRIEAWQATKAGRLPVVCNVTRNGKPLEGAEVKFVPEAFLGENMPIGSATTDAGGIAHVSIPGAAGTPHDPLGVPPGFYRVEITKPGLDIPARYNTATELGEEVAVDSGVLQNDLPINLAF